MLTMIIVLVLIFLILMKLFVVLTCGKCKNYVCLVGKTAIVTGGNSGIGFQTALGLAARGCRVIIADKDNCDKSKEKIFEATGNTNIIGKYVNLASLTSIRRFAKEMIDSEDRLDILINNAAAAGLGNYRSEDGLNIGMQTNHFGPFLLTNLLIGLLKKSEPSRIIFVSSCMVFNATVNAELLNFFPDEKPTLFSELTMYATSKLCNLLISHEFAEKLRGTGVTCNALHPGNVIGTTKIFDSMYQYSKIFSILTAILGDAVSHFGKTPEEGAQTSLHLATAKEVEKVTGKFFWDCKPFFEPALAKDKKLRRTVWETSESYVKLKPHERL